MCSTMWRTRGGPNPALICRLTCLTWITYGRLSCITKFSGTVAELASEAQCFSEIRDCGPHKFVTRELVLVCNVLQHSAREVEPCRPPRAHIAKQVWGPLHGIRIRGMKRSRCTCAVPNGMMCACECECPKLFSGGPPTAWTAIIDPRVCETMAETAVGSCMPGVTTP